MAYFSTGLVSNDWMQFPERHFAGRGWTVHYRKFPASGTTIIASDGKRKFKSKELIIEAADKEKAFQFFALLLAAWNAIDVSPMAIEAHYHLVTISSLNQVASRTDFEHRAVTLTGGFPSVLRLACKASRCKKLQYAIVKLYLSVRHCCVHEMDFVEGKHVGVTSSCFTHVSLAVALFLAYSALEELGFEPRGASRDRPLIKDGVWDSGLRSELERRLIRGGINLGEKLLWMKRYKPTRIEQMATLPGGGTKWGFGPMRDQEVNIVDAIAVASRLRSRITAHRLPEIASSLTIYDVGNIQQLTRRLILESCGMWDNTEI